MATMTRSPDRDGLAPELRVGAARRMRKRRPCRHVSPCATEPVHSGPPTLDWGRGHWERDRQPSRAWSQSGRDLARPVLALAAGHNSERLVRQRPLELECYLGRSSHPAVDLLGGGQDHLHGLGVDRGDDAVRRVGQEAEYMCSISPSAFFRTPVQGRQIPVKRNDGLAWSSANQTGVLGRVFSYSKNEVAATGPPATRAWPAPPIGAFHVAHVGDWLGSDT